MFASVWYSTYRRIEKKGEQSFITQPIMPLEIWVNNNGNDNTVTISKLVVCLLAEYADIRYRKEQHTSSEVFWLSSWDGVKCEGSSECWNRKGLIQGSYALFCFKRLRKATQNIRIENVQNKNSTQNLPDKGEEWVQTSWPQRSAYHVPPVIICNRLLRNVRIDLLFC